MRTCLAPSLRKEYKGLKEIRAPTRRERGVCPVHLGLTSLPSSNVGGGAVTRLLAAVSDAAIWTNQQPPLLPPNLSVLAMALPLEDITEWLWNGEDDREAILIQLYGLRKSLSCSVEGITNEGQNEGRRPMDFTWPRLNGPALRIISTRQ